MDEKTKKLHLEAGKRAGVEATCGLKIKYSTEEKAEKAASKMNMKPSTRKELEAYPCYFCDKFHIGRKMSQEELGFIPDKVVKL